MPKYTKFVPVKFSNLDEPVWVKTFIRTDENLPLAYPIPKHMEYTLHAEEIDGELKAVPYVTITVRKPDGFNAEMDVPYHELPW